MVVLLRYIFQKKNKKKFWTKLRDLLFSIYGEGEGRGKGREAKERVPEKDGRGGENQTLVSQRTLPDMHQDTWFQFYTNMFISEYSYIIQTCHVIAKSTNMMSCRRYITSCSHFCMEFLVVVFGQCDNRGFLLKLPE